jgi:hypothetical protein
MAETFLGPTLADNRLVVDADKVALIQQISFGVKLARVQIVAAGATNDLELGFIQPRLTALVGPAEIIALDPVVISYRIFASDQFRNIFAKDGSNYEIAVPEGKTIHFLPSTTRADGLEIRVATFTKGFSSAPYIRVLGGAEYDGPLQISFTHLGTSALIAYYFTEKATALPDGVRLQGGTGTSQIVLEKSADLAKWLPSVLLPIDNTEKAFFRLKIGP